MKARILVGALLATAIATPATAQMSGPRAEVRAGYDIAKVKLNYDDGDEVINEKGKDNGILYGFELGYDHNFGGGIIGAYAGMDMSSIKECMEVFGEDEACAKLRRNFTIGLRTGITPSENVLLYVKGGYSNGKAKVTYEDFEGILEDESASGTRSGYHAGVGAEFAFSKKVYAKLDYTYTSYKGFDEIDDTRVKFSRSQVAVGLGVRF